MARRDYWIKPAFRAQDVSALLDPSPVFSITRRRQVLTVFTLIEGPAQPGASHRMVVDDGDSNHGVLRRCTPTDPTLPG